MKAPLAIYVVYHSEYNKASQIFSKIYKWLCRDVRNSLSDGLDIPVYFATETNGFEVDFERAEKTCVIVLSDEHLVHAKDVFLPKIIGWHGMTDYEKHIMVCPVKLCKYAFDAFPNDVPDQCIVLEHEDIETDWDEFQTRIYDCLIRFIKNKDSKVRIFVSHSKRDKDKIGEVRAKELARYLRDDTKLDSFFDVTDIVDGRRFDQQIMRGVENALLMILYTNTYSDREWCRRELIAAKDHNVPTVVVMMLDGVAKRIFPYIGNVPCVEFKGGWREPINLLLRTALDEYHEQELLTSLRQDREDVQTLPFPPELYNLLSMPNDKSCVLYPEPPLGQEELTILKQAHEGVSFVTPMEFASAGLDLKGKYIAISISNSEDAARYGMGQEMLDDVSIEISKHVLKAGGKMIYGGNLSKNGFTKLFANLSDQFGAFEKSDSIVRYFKNYLAWPYYVDMDEKTAQEYEHYRVELVKVEKGSDGADSLTKMRKEMEKDASARIVVGGKMTGFAGSMPGILEEFQIALTAKHPVYVVGGFGGAARYIGDMVSGARLCDEQYAWLKDIAFDNLCNGLSRDENMRLFETTNAIEIVSLLLKGLKNTLYEA